MSEQNPDQIPITSTPSSTYQSWHEYRRAERWAHREARRQRHDGHLFGLIGGVFLTLLGAIFLLEYMGIPFMANWWALFIFIPTFWTYAAAWDNYKNHDQLTRGGAGSLTVGILLTILAFVFLFNLDTGLVWPVLLIVGGLVLLGMALFTKEP